MFNTYILIRLGIALLYGGNVNSKVDNLNSPENSEVNTMISFNTFQRRNHNHVATGENDQK